MAKRKPLKELYVGGSFTEDRTIWKTNYKDTVKKCAKTWKKRSRDRKRGSRSTGRQEAGTSRKKE